MPRQYGFTPHQLASARRDNVSPRLLRDFRRLFSRHIDNHDMMPTNRSRHIMNAVSSAILYMRSAARNESFDELRRWAFAVSDKFS